jgi:hypothetical protein
MRQFVKEEEKTKVSCGCCGSCAPTMYDDPSFSKFGVINILTSANLPPPNQLSASFKGRVAYFDHGGEPAAAKMCVSMNVPSPSWLVWNSDTKNRQHPR